MGMGMAPASCWTTDSAFVAKTCKKEWKEFEKRIDACGFGMGDFALAITREYEVDYDDDEKIAMANLAYDELCKAFKKKTQLDINIAYHDSREEGDRYDDVNGVYWELDGVTTMTPAGKKLKGNIKYSRWCVYG